MQTTIRDPKRRLAIRRLEILARSRPAEFRQAYRAEVLRGVAHLAFWVFAPLALALGGVAALLWLPGYWALDAALILVGLFGFGAMTRCLRFDLPPSQGITLDRRTHPLLFKDLNEIRQAIRAPKFNRVEFSMDYNAGVIQTPRFGGLLGAHNVLVIGFPLIFTLKRDELRAVLAHEMAHVSRNHGIATLFTFRLRLALALVYASLARRSSWLASILIGRSLDRLMPTLLDHDQVMHRLHELEADRLAAQACGAQLCADTLVKIELLGRVFAEDFHGSIEAEVRRSDIPTLRHLDHFLKVVERARREEQRTCERLEVEMVRPPDLGDSHPTLQERLKSVGATPSDTVDLDGGAAEEYFGRRREDLINELDRQWLSAVIPGWRARHDAYRKLRQRLDAKRDLQDKGEKLFSFEYGQIAAWIEDLHGERDALVAYADYHRRFPYLSEGRFHYGRLLLAGNDDRGIAVLEELVRVEPTYREASLQVLSGYFLRRRRTADLDRCLAQLEACYRDFETVMKDRLEITPTTVFTPHNLERPMVESIYKLCAELPEVTSLHLLRKQVAHFPETPFFVVAVQFDKRVRAPDRLYLLDLIRGVIDLPGDCLAVDAQRSSPVRKALQQHALAAKAYDRADG